MQKYGCELLTSVGSWYGFGFRVHKRELPTLRLGVLRFRLAVPDLEDSMTKRVAERRAKANDNKPRADGE